MIEIDLLPAQLRKREKGVLLKGVLLGEIFAKKFILLGLGCLVLFHLFLCAVTAVNAKRLSILKRNLAGLSSKRGVLSDLRGEFAEINRKIPLIEKVISNRVIWSRKLNRISDLVIQGIWLNALSVEQQKAQGRQAQECLVIRGSAASRIQQEPALIGRFMQNLKDDPAFSADFAEIELGPIKKRKIAKTEVMDFILFCRFKEDKTKALIK